MGVSGIGITMGVWLHSPLIKMPMTVTEETHVPSYYSMIELGIDPKTVERRKELSSSMTNYKFYDPEYTTRMGEVRLINAGWSMLVTHLRAWRRRRAAIKAWELAN